MATYMDDANQAGNVGRSVTAAQTAIATAYGQDVADRQTKAQTRDNKNQTSHNKWVTLPMNWPDVRKASREIGWKKYTGQNVDQNLLNQLQTLINNHRNGGNGGQPQQGQGRRIPQVIYTPSQGQQQPTQSSGPQMTQQQWNNMTAITPQQATAIFQFMQQNNIQDFNQATQAYLASQRPTQQSAAPVSGVGFGTAPTLGQGEIPASPPNFGQQTV